MFYQEEINFFLGARFSIFPAFTILIFLLLSLGKPNGEVWARAVASSPSNLTFLPTRPSCCFFVCMRVCVSVRV